MRSGSDSKQGKGLLHNPARAQIQATCHPNLLLYIRHCNPPPIRSAPASQETLGPGKPGVVAVPRVTARHSPTPTRAITPAGVATSVVCHTSHPQPRSHLTPYLSRFHKLGPSLGGSSHPQPAWPPVAANSVVGECRQCRRLRGIFRGLGTSRVIVFFFTVQ